MSVDLNVEELKLPREGLREMLQCYARQHSAASSDLREHPRGHSSWRESTRMKFMNIPMEYSKMRSESSEYMWKTRAMLISLESYFGKICTGSLGEIGWILICILCCGTRSF